MLKKPGVKLAVLDSAPERPSRRRRLMAKSSDEVRFFRTWLRRPLVMGAVSPSSRQLGRLMASHVPNPDEFQPQTAVIELGPGTGVVTQCLIERGVPEAALVLVEYSEEFCVLLRSRFPKATVIQGDAYAISQNLGALLGRRPLAAVVSGLPLMTKPDILREGVVAGSLKAMGKGAPFIQFSYALTVPVKPDKVGAVLQTSGWIKRNFPPARVIVYRKTETPA